VNKIWQSLSRESSLAAEHLAIGVTALGKANCAKLAYYSQAFFSLTTGFERASKLSIVVDYCLENKGDFPTNDVLREYGHDLATLLNKANKIAERRKLNILLPNTEIHKGIIKVLTDFANNITRYYNIDFITKNPKTKEEDPIKSWFQLVTIPVLKKHKTQKQIDKVQRNAHFIDKIIGSNVMIIHHTESGDELNTIYEAFYHTGIIDLAKPDTRMYVMQISRFLGSLLSKLGNVAYSTGIDTIPCLSEFFVIFNNNDKYFKNRKTWSIYSP
jgi:hypothetical protein